MTESHICLSTAKNVLPITDFECTTICQLDGKTCIFKIERVFKYYWKEGESRGLLYTGLHDNMSFDVDISQKVK